ncbi:MAG: glycosyl hydrolase family 28-related protein [Armatimonadota bacterium]
MKRLLLLVGIALLASVIQSSVVCAATDPYYDVRDYASFSAAVTAIGSNWGSLRIPNRQYVTSNVTVPRNIQLVFLAGGILNISSGYTVTIQGNIQAPTCQIFENSGNVYFDNIVGFLNEAEAAWFGAVGDNGTDDTAAINKAINSFSTAEGGPGGTVRLSRGTYVITGTIYVKTNTRLVGAGPRRTGIRNNYAGPAIYLYIGTRRASVEDITIVLGNSSAGGIWLDADNGYDNIYNTFSNIEIVGANPIQANQYGVKLDASANPGITCVTFNHFYNLFMSDIAVPVYLSSESEGNIFYGLHIERFGTSSQPVAVTVQGHANQFYGAWVGGRGDGCGSGQILYGFQASVGSKNSFFANGDMGIGYLYDMQGGEQLCYGTGMGDTGFANSNCSNWLGPLHPLSNYDSGVIERTGYDKYLWMLSVSGFSNGFTVDYKNSPQSMLYSFSNGPVGIGVTPSASGSSSLHLAGGISQTSTPAKNLRGSIVISNTATSGTVTFGTAESDTGYFATATVTSTSGSPAATAKRVSISNKTVNGFTITLEAAPGSSKSVTVDWMLLR